MRYRSRVRLRLPELLEQSGLTAYKVAKASDGRVSLTTIYRLTRSEGRVESFDGELLEALCDVFGVGVAELLEREPAKRSRSRR